MCDLLTLLVGFFVLSLNRNLGTENAHASIARHESNVNDAQGGTSVRPSLVTGQIPPKQLKRLKHLANLAVGQGSVMTLRWCHEWLQKVNTAAVGRASFKLVRQILDAEAQANFRVELGVCEASSMSRGALIFRFADG